MLWAKYPFTSQDQDFSRNERMRLEHEDFLSKVVEGDHDSAVDSMVSHIRKGWRQLLDTNATKTA